MKVGYPQNPWVAVIFRTAICCMSPHLTRVGSLRAVFLKKSRMASLLWYRSQRISSPSQHARSAVLAVQSAKHQASLCTLNISSHAPATVQLPPHQHLHEKECPKA